MNQFQQVVSNQGILGGKPYIRGIRISVQLILAWVIVGTIIQEISDRYPYLTYEGM